MDFLSIFALVLLFVIVIVLSYGLIIIHDIPHKIAKARNHPHADAIEAAGWVSLFLMHAIWPFLWIWAMLYRPGVGFGMGTTDPGKPPADDGTATLAKRLDAMEHKLAELESGAASAKS